MDVQVKEEKCDIISHNDINPWNVSDASVFLKYSCPECEFQSKGLDTFGEHAIANHHRSSVLFKPEQTELKSELQDVSDYIDEDDYMLVEPKVKIDLANTEKTMNVFPHYQVSFMISKAITMISNFCKNSSLSSLPTMQACGCSFGR